MNNHIFKWDNYSDQPHILRDKKVKNYIYKKAFIDTLKIITTNIILFPLILIRFGYSFFENKKQKKDYNNFFAMGVNMDKEPEIAPLLVKELGVKEILIRLPLSDIKNIHKYKNFTEKFPDCNILINILQDRDHITNKKLLQESIFTVFNTLHVSNYQIGNAINRKKWAFYTMDEYLSFYKTIQDIRDANFPDIKLIGSSIIDFEYHFTVRTLFNLYKIHYDKFSSLLYVDRRGSPQNTQMGFDLTKKIKLLYSIVSLSPKTKKSIIITETNWPISNTAPYAPTSEKECVSPETYALYMVQYYLLVLSTTMVEKIYWHQLIAPGYGLVDNRKNIRKYPAFEAYKTMVSLLGNAKLVKFDFSNEIKYLKFERDIIIEVYWSENRALKKLNSAKLLSLYGKKYNNENFMYAIRSKVDKL